MKYAYFSPISLASELASSGSMVAELVLVESEKDGLLLDRRGGLVIAGIGTFGWLCLGLLVRLEMVRGARCVC